jgi:hypothetical protein
MTDLIMLIRFVGQYHPRMWFLCAARVLLLTRSCLRGLVLLVMDIFFDAICNDGCVVDDSVIWVIAFDVLVFVEVFWVTKVILVFMQSLFLFGPYSPRMHFAGPILVDVFMVAVVIVDSRGWGLTNVCNCFGG